MIAAQISIAPGASGQVMDFSKSDLPIIVIETDGSPIQDEPKTAARIRVYDNPGRENSIYGQPAHEGDIAIEVRGNSSQAFPKKQYGFETRDSNGGDTDVELLGMPAEEDWVLSSPYSDKSLIRNALAMRLASSMGRYASRTAFCELVLNGDYQGVYLLMERIKRGPDRVDIAKLNPDENEGESMTGGYIFKMDPGKGVPFEGWSASFDSTGYCSYLYHYPQTKDITAHQRGYIVTFFQKFEDAMRLSDFADPGSGYRSVVDATSFIDFFLMQEAANNVDGYVSSVYFHKDRDRKDGRLKLGPVWDFDIAYGNCNYNDGEATEGWRISRQNRPFWWLRLLEDPLFLLEAGDRWKELRTSVWSDPAIMQHIDSLAVLLRYAGARNFQRWKLLGEWVWPNWYVGLTHKDEIAYLKNWMLDRLHWIDENIDFLSPTAAGSPGAPGIHAISDIYPQPARDALRVECSLRGNPDACLTLTDHLGRTVLKLSNAGLAQGRWNATLNTGALPSGAFLLRLHAGGASADARVVLLVK